ncbi:hypothetical protein JOD82_002196 [Paenibacillus sp. 1182]|uniref:hypothetical protein n=1 Tax=Paenibacillus sp. 1182 TaxID=2806565 RepID=UPI001AE83238|nr:hypothetical protein [Paenibacillus sp. 1182]MBP1309176.1 hypothetical protein [Paenibacillus sp. 1182]
MVKKIASLIMIVTFVMGFSVSAFAQENSIDFSKIQAKKPATIKTLTFGEGG